MKTNAERIFAILIITSFILTSIIVLVVGGDSLSRDEAIEISKNTQIVQEALNYGGMNASRVTADHWNATHITLLKQEHPNLREIENLPEDHGVWRVFWVILPGYHILHFIDELTGQVLYEGVAYIG